MKIKLPRVARALKRVGSDLRTARIRRRISQKDLALLMGVSIGTVQRMEQGDAGVAIGHIATACSCMNCLDKFASLLDPTVDELGMVADSFRLPQRVRSTLQQQDQDEANPSADFDPIAF